MHLSTNRICLLVMSLALFACGADSIKPAVGPASESDALTVRNDRIMVGEVMHRGDYKTSPDGRFVLTFQVDDGNLCVRENGVHRWCSMVTTQADAFTLTVQGRAELYIACPNNTSDVRRVLQAFTDEVANADRIELRNDGSVVLVGKDNRVKWSMQDGVFHRMHELQHWYYAPIEHPDPSKRSTSLAKPPVDLFGKYYRKHLMVYGVHLLGTAAVADATMLLVRDQVQVMIDSLTLSRDKALFYDSLPLKKIVVISQYDKFQEMQFANSFASCAQLQDLKDSSNDWARGWASAHYVIVTEEMVCRTGVAGAARRVSPWFPDGREHPADYVQVDTTYRALDQVVHEVGHMIDLLTQKNNPYYRDPLDGSNLDHGNFGWFGVEDFAYTTQGWFGQNQNQCFYIDSAGQAIPKSQVELNVERTRYVRSIFNKPSRHIDCPNTTRLVCADGCPSGTSRTADATGCYYLTTRRQEADAAHSCPAGQRRLGDYCYDSCRLGFGFDASAPLMCSTRVSSQASSEPSLQPSAPANPMAIVHDEPPAASQQLSETDRPMSQNDTREQGVEFFVAGGCKQMRPSSVLYLLFVFLTFLSRRRWRV